MTCGMISWRHFMTGISDSPELTDKASSAASKIDGVARRCGESTNRHSRHSHTDCMYWHIMRPLSLDPFLQKEKRNFGIRGNFTKIWVCFIFKKKNSPRKTKGDSDTCITCDKEIELLISHTCHVDEECCSLRTWCWTLVADLLKVLLDLHFAQDWYCLLVSLI